MISFSRVTCGVKSRSAGRQSEQQPTSCSSRPLPSCSCNSSCSALREITSHFLWFLNPIWKWISKIEAFNSILSVLSQWIPFGCRIGCLTWSHQDRWITGLGLTATRLHSQSSLRTPNRKIVFHFQGRSFDTRPYWIETWPTVRDVYLSQRVSWGLLPSWLRFNAFIPGLRILPSPFCQSFYSRLTFKPFLVPSLTCFLFLS
jgi:hypothetical protein